MSRGREVSVRELIAWGLDEYGYRSVTQETMRERSERARAELARRGEFQSSAALMLDMTKVIAPILATYLERTDLEREMDGLDWMLGVVDLGRLLAFQRRLIFDPRVKQMVVPVQDDWASLAGLALPPARRLEYLLMEERGGFRLTSENPNLQWSVSPVLRENDPFPLQVHGGSPFFEVAELRGRWFLRDGYHRAYGLLRAGVRYAVAVIIRARSIEEVGATQSWFFDEAVLFSAQPPRLTDFLEDDLTVQYNRPRLEKRLHVRVEEVLVPAEELEMEVVSGTK